MNKTLSVMVAAAGVWGGACSQTLPGGTSEENTVQIRISCNKKDFLYCPGEPAEFRIAVMRGGEKVSSGELSVYAAQDGGPGNGKYEKFDLAKGNPVVMKAAADEPCYLLCRAEYGKVSNWEMVWYRTPEQKENLHKLHLLPGDPLYPPLNVTAQNPPEPADFDVFWDRTLKEARELPHRMQLEELSEYTSEKCRYYRFAMNTLNNEQVHGFLSVPNGRGPFPVLVSFPGSGAPSVKPIDGGWGPAGCIVVDFSVHKFRSPKTPAEATAAMKAYEAQHRVDYYWKIGVDSREKFHFYTVIPGFCRVLDYVTEKMPWDKKHLVISGGSQGGWATLVMSALYRDRVSALYCSVPDCGFSSALRPEKNRRNLPYYEGDYFARRITAPAFVVTGRNDNCCPPDTVCAMFSILGSKEKKLEIDNGGHLVVPLRQKRAHEFLMKALGLKNDKSRK